MKEFFKSRTGKAIAVALSSIFIFAICTPLFDLLFHGEVNWDANRYVLEPILTGIFVGLFEYFLPSANNEKEKK